MKKILTLLILVIFSFVFLVSCGEVSVPSENEVSDFYEETTNMLFRYYYAGVAEAAKTDIEDLDVYEDQFVYSDTNVPYYKTNYTYQQALDKYSEYFTGQLLDDFMTSYFYDDDGTFCVFFSGGASGSAVDDVVATLKSQDGNIYNYDVIYSFYEGPMTEPSQGESTFSLEINSDGYRLLDTEVAYPMSDYTDFE